VVITALAAQADWLLTLDEAAGTVTSDADILRDAVSGGGAAHHLTSNKFTRGRGGPKDRISL
jgi:hypothetical protein